MEFKGGGWTNLNAAHNAFSKSAKNKIIFTDAEHTTSDSLQLTDKNITWLVFNNRNFKPQQGRVIFVDASKIRLNMEENEQNF